MTSTNCKSEVGRTSSDSLECSSFFVFHSSNVRERQWDIKSSRGSLLQPKELSHFEEIEARFLIASNSNEDKESLGTESNPDASAMNMDDCNEKNVAQWTYYPNSMQVPCLF